MTVRWLEIFEQWAADPGEPLDRRWVHKDRPENVLVSRSERVGDDLFAVRFAIPLGHPFFFEHDVDHVPGLLLIEAGRQAGLVAAHSHYGVPLEGYTFLLGGMEADFQAFAELDAPLFGVGVVTDVVMKGGVARTMTYGGHFFQAGRAIGRLSGRWTIVPDAVAARMRRSG